MSSRSAMALAHSRTMAFAKRLDQTRKLIDQALSAAPSWYVAFSAGKDSTCVLHLVRAANPSVIAITSVRQWDLPETEALYQRTDNLQPITYDGYNGEPWSVRWRDREHAKAHHPTIQFLDGRDQILSRGREEQGVFLGLRSEEAQYRKFHLGRMGPLFHCHKTGKWHSNPISLWSVIDVWAYIHSRGVDYNRAYDVMQSAGIPLREQRIGPFDHALHGGALAILKRCWPDVFTRIAAAHPEARAYV